MMKKTLLAVLAVVGVLAAAAPRVEAAPLYSCPNGSTECAGQTFALWVEQQVDADTFVFGFSIYTHDYNGPADSYANAFGIKDLFVGSHTLSNPQVIQAPTGTSPSDWNIAISEVNANGCGGGGGKGSCVEAKVDPGVLVNAPGVDYLTWLVQVDVSGSTTLSDEGHIKYLYVSENPKKPGEWKKAAGMLSQDIPLQDCRLGCGGEDGGTVPEPAAMVLLGLGLVAAASRLRRR